jgi:flagellar biosynthetic protein FliR
MLTFTEAQLMAWVTPVFWPFLRILAVFTAAPVLSNKATPARTRIALSFVIALAVQPALPESTLVSLNGPEALAAVAQQVLVGLAIGFAVRLVFASVELAGELTGLQMGLNFASFFDPLNGGQSSAVARFLAHIAALLFVVLNGHFMVASVVIRSFERFPVDGNPLESLKRLPLHHLGADMFAYGLSIALPMVGILLFVNIVLGFLSRIAPQMNVFAIGFPVTLTAGLIGIAATLPMLDGPYTRLTERAFTAIVGG